MVIVGAVSFCVCLLVCVCVFVCVFIYFYIYPGASSVSIQYVLVSKAKWSYFESSGGIGSLVVRNLLMHH